MTNTTMHEKSTPRWRAKIISVSLLLLTLGFGLTASAEAAEYVKEGMKLAVGCVIPSSFPFMIISDLYAIYGRPENIPLIGALIRGLLGIPSAGLSAFICGNVGGFPIGAKMCADAYSAGALTKEDAERLMPLSNNPSSAFVIGGVGAGMWKDLRIGFILLVSVILSTALCGTITRGIVSKKIIYDNNIRQNYSFVDSVKRSGTSCIGIISFISIFSVLLGIIKKRVKYAPLLYVIFTLSEVTNATSSFSNTGTFPMQIRLSLTAFSLGFGGLCVGLQSAYFASMSGLSMKKYYAIKLLEGIVSASIAPLLFSLFIA